MIPAGLLGTGPAICTVSYHTQHMHDFFFIIMSRLLALASNLKMDSKGSVYSTSACLRIPAACSDRQPEHPMARDAILAPASKHSPSVEELEDQSCRSQMHWLAHALYTVSAAQQRMQSRVD